MSWTVTHHTDVIPGLDVMMHYNENNELQFYEMLPIEGYIIRIYALDEYVTDEEGNRILNKNGDRYIVKPWRTLGSATAVKSYDWELNSQGFSAEVYYEGMEDEIIEIPSENNDTPELKEDIIEKAVAYDILMGASE